MTIDTKISVYIGNNNVLNLLIRQKPILNKTIRSNTMISYVTFAAEKRDLSFRKNLQSSSLSRKKKIFSVPMNASFLETNFSSLCNALTVDMIQVTDYIYNKKIKFLTTNISLILCKKKR